jgi:chorismate dehydratase
VGNEGLRQRHGVPEYPYLYDLGAEWHQWTGLPFVFARWVVRQDLERQATLVLEDALYGGLQDWADGLFRFARSREDVRMHPRDMLEYTQEIRYFIGVTEQRAIDRFRHDLDQLPIPQP